MTAEELLLELRDLQPPVEPGWWLLAPAWSTGLGLMLAILLLSWLIKRHRRKNRLLAEARQILAQIRSTYRREQNSQYTLQSLSAWLRQVAIAAYPERQVAALTGVAWIEFLNQCSPKPAFDREMARVLTEDIYRTEIHDDADQIINACEYWLNAVSDRLRHRGGGYAAA